MTVVIAGVAVLACSKGEKPADQAAVPPAAAPAAPNVVHVEATEYSFSAPDTIPSGVTTFHLMNGGKEIHQVVLFKASADEMKAMNLDAQNPGMVILGGPNAAAPGGTAEATLDLAPGSYSLVCLIPAPDGKPHLAHGMVHSLTVTQGSSTAAMPTPDVTAKLTDYGFEFTPALTAGHHVIRIENAGPQPHEMVFIKLESGKTIEDFGKWATTLTGPPPALPLNGAAPMTLGGANTVSVDLTPGDYGVICFVSDSKDHKPHFMHGMVKQFKVS